jgi:hypothetical protein
VEDGLVSLVTAYHKGYHVTGSTKIIHRYLPESVSKILIYYLWLILPFQQQLRVLLFQDTAPVSAFLWPHLSGCWTSARLSQVLHREFKTCLDINMNIATYRHVAIAVSRLHLRLGGFQREYHIPEHPADIQAAHTSWTSTTMYARGQKEAPGHVEARRWEYRIVSRAWRHLLGFAEDPMPAKRTLADLVQGDVNHNHISKKQKRAQIHGENHGENQEEESTLIKGFLE